MGLLDSVLGAVAGNTSSSAASGGLGGILGTLAQNPQIMQAITGMLGNDGSQGGLGGLIAKFPAGWHGRRDQLLGRPPVPTSRSRLISSGRCWVRTPCPTWPRKSAWTATLPRASCRRSCPASSTG